MTPRLTDPAALAQALIRCPSITPEEAGALNLLEHLLGDLGFDCERLTFSAPGTADVENLYARRGSEGRNLCFAGHSDVVPVGELSAWSVDPFAGTIRDGLLYGRGAVDMKGSIAAFIAAVARTLETVDAQRHKTIGSLSLLITADEEGPAINGTVKVLDWLKDKGETLDHCLVGEPTSAQQLGDMVKIGRRGSLNGLITVYGIQGHSAYPHLADNPLHHMVRMLSPLVDEAIDDGNDYFQASSLQLTSIDVNNAATNVIPGLGQAHFNCRFNSNHQSEDIVAWVHERLGREGARYDLEISVSGESFLCPPGEWTTLVVGSVEKVLGSEPELSTTGGTSDARFIKDHCPVAELGLLNATAHKVDEHVPIGDLEKLTQIYQQIIKTYFSNQT
ncbi:MAG: succinyl-diaminopimelate desuccinylase [Kiloniellales bacterium]|nr:succinyl-diaminopimelate desuccinylase [Kiloniellales bacterium]